MNDPLERLMRYGIPPAEGEIVIAWKDDSTRDMVEIKDGIARLWRYGTTDDVFCNADEIVKWRGCTGLDF